ncbi:efflux RND transporter periplasmic adaptor subunit [Shivajiella indica]|uniref:Efflux RND transporter periplasmic adaptor subunit n=1 Tax=Shivajiella indica TaxID=872115 RepID=A0ABW5BAG7_9BACT
MKQAKFLLTWFLLGLVGCQNPQEHSHDQESSIPTEALTSYTDRLEVFIDFEPLVKSRMSTIMVHITQLGDNFIPLLEGEIDLSLFLHGQNYRSSSTRPDSPGIFELDLTPDSEGVGTIKLEIKTSGFTEKITFENIKVYPNLTTAVRALSQSGNGDEISYLKSQAWRIDFANAQVQKEPFREVLKTSGKILSAPGDETILNAKSSGTVLFTGNKSIIGTAVNSGDQLFTISGSGLTQGNPEILYKDAKVKYEQAKADFERAEALVKDQIISEKDFLQAKSNFETASNSYQVISKNFSSAGQIITSPISGFVKNIMVREGQYVETGAPLAQISKNKRLLLQAQVSQKYYNQLPLITAANFRMAGDEKIYDTEAMNGKIVSYGRSSASNSTFVPITFEIDNVGNLIPGAVTEVFLKSALITDALVIPEEALMEELGHHYVFIQTGGETFLKQEVTLGGNDGAKVQVLSGLKEGERVVTKGAYAIKLATSTGAIPEHGHSH